MLNDFKTLHLSVTLHFPSEMHQNRNLFPFYDVNASVLSLKIAWCMIHCTVSSVNKKLHHRCKEMHDLSHVMRKPVFVMCKQQSRRSACASAQSAQRLCFHYHDSIIHLLAIAEISRLYLVSVAELTSLSLTWSKTPKTGFLVRRLI